MTRHLFLVLFAFMIFTPVIAVASEIEPIKVSLESESATTVEPVEELTPTQSDHENFLARIELSGPNQCQYETCDISFECWEGCEAQHPNCPETGDAFCWCVRACADICV